MNIYIFNCSNTFNYGSMMMGENFISYFDMLTKKSNNYFIDSSDDVNINRLKYACDSNNIKFASCNSLFKTINKYRLFMSFLGLNNILTDFAKNIDLVVVLGGDDFTEDYGWKGPVLKAIQFNVLKKNKINVVMLGQTIGPFKSFRRNIMKKLFKNVSMIYPREPITYKYLQDLGLKNISLTDDLALLPLKKQEFKYRNKEHILYCPSELIYRYTQDSSRDNWIKFNMFMIETIMESYPDKKLVLLAHVLQPKHVDDRIIAEELYNLVMDTYKDRIILEIKDLFPYQVRNYIQQSFLTISSRMHPIISSIQCEVPILALSYSTKYWGIIGERYNLSDFIIDVRNMNYDEMKVYFNKTLKQIDNDYMNIQSKMKTTNKLAIETIRNTLNQITRLND